MHVNMLKADHWLAYGLGRFLELLTRRVKEQDVGFQHKISQMFEKHSCTLNSLTIEIINRGIESYGNRNTMVEEINQCILANAAGAVRMLKDSQRQVLIAVPFDRETLIKMRYQLDFLIQQTRE
jgi:hypothetical protein